MTYGIICAMQEEFGVLGEIIDNAKVTHLYGRDFICGEINGKSVIAVVSRIGKVAAAITTSLLIDHFSVDAVLFCGIAGGLGDNVNVGDIIVGSSCIQHDMYISDDDFFRIPLLNITNIPCDKALSEKCVNAAKNFSETAKNEKAICDFYDDMGIDTPRVYLGIIASGDQFINKAEKKAWLKANIDEVLCCEMEGAAVAQACFEANIPCAVIRVISDGADENADFSFDKFVNAASLYSRGIIKEFFS